MGMETSYRIPEARELTNKERLLLEEFLRHGTPKSKVYAEQLPYVTVVSRCSCGCPTIDLAVRGQTAPPGSPSQILSDAGGVSPEQVRFGIIVHAREGLISELEVYPIDLAGTFSLPEIDRIEFYGAA
jgi:hypothetical protein